MSFLELIDSNGYEILLAIIVANFAAQIIKTFFYAFKHKQLDLSMLFTTGGMPSSHSASVTAMTTSTGFVAGFDSAVFAISFCISAIVMYDSAGVRQSAGKQAKVLNQIMVELLSEEHHLNQDKLKEFLGHTPIEVIAGALFGVVISFLMRFAIESALV